MRLPALLVVAAVVAVLVAALLWSRAHPRRIVGYGTTTAESRYGNGRASARTRTVEIAGARLEEVELPNGTWIDCGGDCAEALRRERLDYWESRREQGR